MMVPRLSLACRARPHICVGMSLLLGFLTLMMMVVVSGGFHLSDFIFLFYANEPQNTNILKQLEKPGMRNKF